jgi:hypothetical protein
LGDHTNVAFYQPYGDVGTHLVLLPTGEDSMRQHLKIHSENEETLVKCLFCDHYIGRQQLFNSVDLIYFSGGKLDIKKIDDEDVVVSKWKNYKLLEGIVRVLNMKELGNEMGIVSVEPVVSDANIKRKPTVIIKNIEELEKWPLFPPLSKLKPRLYQCELFAKAVTGNTLLYLPTGAGKT